MVGALAGSEKCLTGEGRSCHTLLQLPTQLARFIPHHRPPYHCNISSYLPQFTTLLETEKDATMTFSTDTLRPLAVLILSILMGCSDNVNQNALLPVSERPLTGTDQDGEVLRQVAVAGAPNFRDLGGYKTHDGREVQWGKIYRSSKLDKLDADDVSFVRRLSLTTVYDFRTPEKWTEAPSNLPKGGRINIKQRPIASGEIGKSEVVDALTAGTASQSDAADYMRNVYVDIVKNHRATLSELLRDAANPEATPLLFHCTAGKDRTGIGAALILLALGVPRETVVQDYLLSNRYNHHGIERRVTLVKLVSLLRADDDATRALMGVDQTYIEAAFAHMEDEFGSIDGYMTNALGVDKALRSSLRANLLSP
jgi:protein-tyrosine phosphatase